MYVPTKFSSDLSLKLSPPTTVYLCPIRSCHNFKSVSISLCFIVLAIDDEGELHVISQLQLGHDPAINYLCGDSGLRGLYA